MQTLGLELTSPDLMRMERFFVEPFQCLDGPPSKIVILITEWEHRNMQANQNVVELGHLDWNTRKLISTFFSVTFSVGRKFLSTHTFRHRGPFGLSNPTHCPLWALTLAFHLRRCCRIYHSPYTTSFLWFLSHMCSSHTNTVRCEFLGFYMG